MLRCAVHLCRHYAVVQLKKESLHKKGQLLLETELCNVFDDMQYLLFSIVQIILIFQYFSISPESCVTTFTRQQGKAAYITNHLETHTGEKHFSCNQCT